jgi:multidrug efflux system membrane fusion protein
MVRIAACVLVLLTTAAGANEALRPVRVQTVHFEPEQAAVTYPGTVQARVQASLGFRVGGQVTERLVDIGDRVVVGQALARLDPLDSRLNVEASGQAVRAAEAEAVNARADYGRYQRIGPASPAWLPSEFDRRQAALDGAEARLAQAQRQFAMARDQLGYTTLIADAPGVITDLRLEVGQVVAAGQTVFTLAHTAETEIVVDVPENRLPDIRAARSVTIRLWSQPDAALTGRVREIGALADPTSRTFAVKVTVVDAPSSALSAEPRGSGTPEMEPLRADTLRLGMTAAVRFSRDSGATVAYLPASAVVSADGAPSVWVLDPATHRAVAHRVQVTAWLGDGEVAIASGIEPGAQVVTAGAAQLDGATPVAAWVGAIR